MCIYVYMYIYICVSVCMYSARWLVLSGDCKRQGSPADNLLTPLSCKICHPADWLLHKV